MHFHTEERQIWLRSHAHTVVHDRDPDFARFAGEPHGHLQRVLRIWLAKNEGSRPHLRVYLGAISCYVTGPSFRDLRHLLRLATAAAADSNTSGRHRRRSLIALVRRHSRGPAALPR
jgi:hypothetical protein